MKYRAASVGGLIRQKDQQSLVAADKGRAKA
jgi:hypothetical protein